MKKIIILFTFLFSAFYLRVAGQKSLISISNNLENPSDSFPWINQSTVIKGAAFSGDYFSSTDSIKKYGFGYKGAFPESCRNKNLHIRFSEYLRTNILGNEFSMVVTVSRGDSTILWDSKKASDKIKSPGSWMKMENEIEIPSNLTGKENIFSIYLWNKDGLSVVDLDNFQIDFEEKEFLSFLPKGFINIEISDGWQRILNNNTCSVYYNKEHGLIKILNPEGDTILKTLSLFSEWSVNGSVERKQNWNNHFEFKKDSVSKDGNYLRFEAHDNISQDNILFFAGDQNKMTFNVSTIFTSAVSLFRHSIVTGFVFPVKEVYKKSTLTDSVNFSNDYWLDKEGFKLSNQNSSIVLYHPEKISSIQLDIQNDCAIMNIDYYADHPQLYFPLLKKSEGKYVDHSTSVFNKGDLIQSSFTFFSVVNECKIPKLMSNPYGYLSSFTWTEHADYTDLRTQKAVYLGSEKINRLDDATGGFLKYSIPVTKSIFYANPDNADNSEKAGFMKGPVANYKSTGGYSNFLKLLNESGIEICLHTPDQYTCDRKLLSEALDVTKREFSPVTWIDHGYDNSIKSNREDISCDGADSTKQWYSGDLWKKYGIKYFWNSYFEDTGVYKDYSFNSFFSVPYSGWDNGLPTPLYWRNKTRTDNFISWRTTNTMDPPDGSLWSYYFSDVRLTDLVNNRNNIIIHCYPARVDSTNGFYEIKDGVVTANEEFNLVLKKLSSYRLQQKIRLNTIRELLDYKTSLENITYEIKPDGIIRIQNNGRETIRGLSFSVNAKEVKIGQKEIKSKNIDNEIIFWFDISPGESVNMIFK